MEIVERQPWNYKQLSRITGVGKKKLEAYADQFLKTIQQHAACDTNPTSNSDTMEETLQLLRSGMDVNAIASHRSLKPTTIIII